MSSWNDFDLRIPFFQHFRISLGVGAEDHHAIGKMDCLCAIMHKRMSLGEKGFGREAPKAARAGDDADQRCILIPITGECTFPVIEIPQARRQRAIEDLRCVRARNDADLFH